MARATLVTQRSPYSAAIATKARMPQGIVQKQPDGGEQGCHTRPSAAPPMVRWRLGVGGGSVRDGSRLTPIVPTLQRDDVCPHIGAARLVPNTDGLRLSLRTR